MRDMPIVRLQVDALGQQISSAFMVHADEVSAEVQAAISETVKNFDFEQSVARQARPIIEKAVGDAIASFFGWGEGKKILDAAVMKSLKHLGEP